MSFINMIVIRIHSFENFLTDLTLVLLTVSVSALYMSVHVGALALVITDQAPPYLSADIFHSFSGFVFRIYKFEFTVVASSVLNDVVFVAVTHHTTVCREGLLTQITRDLLAMALFVFSELPPRLQDLFTEVTGEGGVRVLPLGVLVETDLVFVGLAADLTRLARPGVGVLPLNVVSQGPQFSGSIVTVLTEEGPLSVAL